MQEKISPIDALNNLKQVADAALLNAQNRVAIDESIKVLQVFIISNSTPLEDSSTTTTTTVSE